jgi:hypothetical protein
MDVSMRSAGQRFTQDSCAASIKVTSDTADKIHNEFSIARRNVHSPWNRNYVGTTRRGCVERSDVRERRDAVQNARSS